MMPIWAVCGIQNVFDIHLLILNTAGQCLYMYIKTYTYVEILNQTNFLIRLWLWSSRCSTCVMHRNLSELMALRSDSLCLAAQIQPLLSKNPSVHVNISWNVCIQDIMSYCDTVSDINFLLPDKTKRMNFLPPQKKRKATHSISSRAVCFLAKTILCAGKCSSVKSYVVTRE